MIPRNSMLKYFKQFFIKFVIESIIAAQQKLRKNWDGSKERENGHLRFFSIEFSWLPHDVKWNSQYINGMANIWEKSRWCIPALFCFRFTLWLQRPILNDFLTKQHTSDNKCVHWTGGYSPEGWFGVIAVDIQSRHIYYRRPPFDGYTFSISPIWVCRLRVKKCQLWFLVSITKRFPDVSQSFSSGGIFLIYYPGCYQCWMPFFCWFAFALLSLLPFRFPSWLRFYGYFGTALSR